LFHLVRKKIGSAAVSSNISTQWQVCRSVGLSSNLLGAYLYWYSIQCQNVASDVTVPAPLHNNSFGVVSSRRIP